MEGAVGACTEQALQRELRDIDVADGLQAVFGERRGGAGADAGQLADGAGPQERVDRLGRVVDDGALPSGMRAQVIAASSRAEFRGVPLDEVPVDRACSGWSRAFMGSPPVRAKFW